MTDPSVFDEHLRAALDAATPPAPDSEGMVAMMQRRMRRRRRRRVGVATALMVGLVAATAVGVAAVGQRRPATHVRVGGSHPAATSVPTRPAPSGSSGGHPRSSSPARLMRPARVVAPGRLVSLDRLAVFQMLTSSVGIAMTGPYGGPNDNIVQAIQLAVTTDGGATWRAEGRPLPYTQKLPSTQTPALPGGGLLAFTNTRVGYALTNHLYTTSNGGLTWTTVPAERVGAREVGGGSTTLASVTAAEGRIWVFSVNCGATRRACTTMAVTTPGSTSWTLDRVPIPDAQLDIDPTAGTVIVTDEAEQSAGLLGRSAISNNGGGTWSRIGLPCAEGQFVAADTDIWFAACHLGGRDHPRHATIYRSTDRGARWQPWASFTQVYGGMTGGPLWTTLAAAGNGTHLWFTSAGFDTAIADLSAGTHTLRTPITLKATLAGLDVLNASHAWLLVPDQGLWVTDNAGSTWTQTSATPNG